MTDTVNVELDVIQRAVAMAKAIMKAEPLYGCVGYHGDEQISGHVEEAADLACLVLDEMADPVLAPNASASTPKAEPVSDPYKLVREAINGLIEWDKKTGFRVPYRVRDPLYSALASVQPLSNPQQLPEAQKGEQDPVGEIAKVIDFAGNPTEVVWTGNMPPIGTKLYTHPAPASDELLEADLMIVADTMKEMQRHIEQLTGARHSMYDGAVWIARSLTKNKGPQS